MKININEEQVKAFGVIAGKIGKQIILEGTKAVVIKATTKTIKASFEDGMDGVKNLSITDLIGGHKKKTKLKDIIEQAKETEVEITIPDSDEK